MGRLFSDFLRAVADGWDKAAGPDPVDQHAAEARELLFWSPPEPGQGAVITGVVKSVSLLDNPHGDQPVRDEDAHPVKPWKYESDDPDEVVVTGPDLTDNQALQVAVHFQETRRELRRFQRMYGKASATIGVLRGRNAFLAEELLGARTTIRLARAELDLAAGESLSDAIAQTRDRYRTLEAKLAEKNRPAVSREDLANQLFEAYTGSPTSAGVRIGWGGVADRAIAVLTGTEAQT